MPDILEGDPHTLETPQDFDRAAWLAKHGVDSWGPIVDKVVLALKAEGVTWIGTTGYCFGTQPVWRLALKGWSQVSVAAHVAGIRVPEDLQVRASRHPPPSEKAHCRKLKKQTGVL